MPIGATKPTAIPRWATDGGTTLDPSSGQKDTGWTNGQRPPFNVMNWWENAVYQWQQYLEDATDELDSEKLERDGSNAVIGNIKPDATGRDLGDTTHRFDLFAQTLDISSTITGNLIPAANGTQTIGASAGNRWDVNVNDLDIDGSITGNLSPVNNGTQKLGADSTHRWDANLNDVDISGGLTLSGSVVSDFLPDAGGTRSLGSSLLPWKNLVVADDAGVPSDDHKNEITGANILKAWAHIKVEHAGGVAVLTVLDGFNLDAGLSVVSGSLHVVWGTNFADDKYGTRCDFEFVGGLTYVLSPYVDHDTKAAGSCDYAFVELLGGGDFSLTSDMTDGEVFYLTVSAWGRQ